MGHPISTARSHRFCAATVALVLMPLVLLGGQGHAAGPVSAVPTLLSAAVNDSAWPQLQFTAFGQRTVFSGFGAHGQQPWITDGTSSGTRLIKDLSPNQLATPGQFTVVGSRCYFVAVHRGSFSLWISDGTATGTRMVKSGFLGNAAGYPNHLTAVGARLFFRVSSQTAGATDQLWVSDGTGSGTKMLKNFPDSPEMNGASANLVAFQGKAYFPAHGSATSEGLWVSDGTPGGTREAVNLSPSDLHVWNGHLLFSGPTGLFTSDGTPGETVPLLSGGNQVSGEYSPTTTAALGDALVFLGSAGGPTGLFRTDGTVAGTSQIPTPANLQITSDPASTGNRVLFAARHTVLNEGSELWSTDGTAVAQIAEIYPGTAGSWPEDLTSVGDRVVFKATGLEGASTPVRLWISDGTPGGTTRLTHQPKDPFDVHAMTYGAGVLYFSEPDSSGVYAQPWAWEPGPTYRSSTTLTVTKPVRYASRPRLGIGVTAAVPLSGTQVTLYDGNSRLATVTLHRGHATWRLPRRFALGSHRLTAIYSASGSVRGSADRAVVTVVRARARLHLTTRPKRVTHLRRAGLMVSVSVRNLVATGRVVVTIRNGKVPLRRLVTHLRRADRGKRVIRLPRLARGRWTIGVKYAGSGFITAAHLRRFPIRVR